MKSSQGAAGPTRYRPGPQFTNMAGLGTSGSAEEVRAQEKQLGFGFDYIVVCTVTGPTHAGMLVGCAKDGRQRNVLGIDASATPARTKAQVLSIALDTAKLVNLGMEIVDDDVVLLEGYASPGYGLPSEATKQAIRLCARLEGIITDPVYEGKSMQGMIDLVQKGFFPEGARMIPRNGERSSSVLGTRHEGPVHQRRIHQSAASRPRSSTGCSARLRSHHGAGMPPANHDALPQRLLVQKKRDMPAHFADCEQAFHAMVSAHSIWS